MKTLKYPKTYAKLIKVTDRDSLGRPLSFTQRVYTYQVVDKETKLPVEPKEIIEASYPNHSGHTPRRAEKIEYTYKVNKKRYTSWNYKMVGEIFKLYKRPQDNGRWCYRWMGQ